MSVALDRAAASLTRDSNREKRGTVEFDYYVDWGLPNMDVEASADVRVTYTVKITDIKIEVVRISDFEVSAFLDEKDDEDDAQLVARKEQAAKREAEAVIRRDVPKEADVIELAEDEVWSSL